MDIKLLSKVLILFISGVFAEIFIPQSFRVMNLIIFITIISLIVIMFVLKRREEKELIVKMLYQLKELKELKIDILEIDTVTEDLIRTFQLHKENVEYYNTKLKELVYQLSGEGNAVVFDEFDKQSSFINIAKAIFIKDDTIRKYKYEIESYKNELNISYNNLLAKSTEIEYKNTLLERRVAKLSSLNAVGKAVLSELEMEKISSTILDSYFVLVSATKIGLYLWEGENLILKAVRGNLVLKNKPAASRANIKGGKDSNYYEEYIKIAELLIESDEVVIVSELKVKGKELGVLFIVEKKENDGDIKKEEIEMISALNIYASISINNAKMYRELSEKQRIDKELGIAREIQLNLLPRDIKSVFGLEIANHFEPAKEVGGDYYDYFISAEGMFGIAIGDVSGKGMPAALLMTTIRAILRTIASYDLLPDVVMTRLNNVIFHDMNEEMFVTLFYSLYDYETSTLFISNAGHNPLIIYDSIENKIIEKSVRGAAIGFSENYNYKLEKLKLNNGDIIVYYTDGITEAENAAGDMFDISRLKEVLYESKDLSAEKIKKNVLNSIAEFRGEYEQVDDITLVVLKVKGWL